MSPGKDTHAFFNFTTGEGRLLAASQRLNKSPLATLFPALVNEACLFAKNTALDDDVCLVGFTYKKPAS